MKALSVGICVAPQTANRIASASGFPGSVANVQASEKADGDNRRITDLAMDRSENAIAINVRTFPQEMSDPLGGIGAL